MSAGAGSPLSAPLLAPEPAAEEAPPGYAASGGLAAPLQLFRWVSPLIARAQTRPLQVRRGPRIDLKYIHYMVRR